MRGRCTHGVITAVQEGRFYLRMPDGATRLFVLSHKSPVEPQDLPVLQQGQVPVVVQYRDSGTLIAAVAYDIARDTAGSREEGNTA